MSYKTLFIFIATTLLLISGCTDDSITNNYIDTSSSIIGRVIPAELNTEISIWQAEKVATTYADSLGYFEILNVPVGIYKLKIKPLDGAMSLENIEVKKNSTTSLGEIKFNNLLWPFIFSSPEHNESSVSVGLQNIVFYCNVPLDFNSFQNSVVFSPPLEGVWQYRDYNKSYYYDIGQELLPGTTYTVTISPSSLLETGESWNDSLQLSFSTTNTAIFQMSSIELPYGLSDVYLSSLYGYSYFLRAFYNINLDTSIAHSAISITPDVNFDITIRNYNSSGSELKISNIEDFIPNKTYTLTIGKELASESGILLGTDEVITFTTEPLMVREYGFRTSSYRVENTTPAYSLSEFRINLNTSVDLDAFNQAVSISPYISGSWATVKRNEYFFIADSNKYLLPDLTYTITIDENTALVADEGFNNDEVLEYFTNSLYIKRLYPSSGQTISTGSYVFVEFASPMKKVITESAFRLKLFNGNDVTGTILWDDDSTYFRFTPADPMISNQYYEMIVDTTAEDINGYNITDAGYSLFRIY